MSYCVIAIKDNFQYRSVFCRCNKDIESTLQRFHGSYSAAKCLVGLGDISQLSHDDVRSYCRDWGFNWEYTQPVELYNRQALIDYARSVGMTSLYIFERNQWVTEKLDNSVLPAFNFVA